MRVVFAIGVMNAAAGIASHSALTAMIGASLAAFAFTELYPRKDQ